MTAKVLSGIATAYIWDSIATERSRFTYSNLGNKFRTLLWNTIHVTQYILQETNTVTR